MEKDVGRLCYIRLCTIPYRIEKYSSNLGGLYLLRATQIVDGCTVLGWKPIAGCRFNPGEWKWDGKPQLEAGWTTHEEPESKPQQNAYAPIARRLLGKGVSLQEIDGMDESALARLETMINVLGDE